MERSTAEKGLDTVEELPVRFRGNAHSNRQLREPPRPRIQQWLDEMKRFLESINEREGELIQERDENRRLCNEYTVQVSERLTQARRQASAILSCMQDTRSTRASVRRDSAVIAPHQDLRQPPALTDLPVGRMDATHLQEMEQCMKGTDEKKNEYVAAVDTREVEINGELDENIGYLAEIRAVVASNENPNTTGTPQPGPGNFAAGIPGINLGTAFGFEGQGSFDGRAQSIPSRLDGTSVSTLGPLGQVGAEGFVPLDVSMITSSREEEEEETMVSMEEVMFR